MFQVQRWAGPGAGGGDTPPAPPANAGDEGVQPSPLVARGHGEAGEGAGGPGKGGEAGRRRKRARSPPPQGGRDPPRGGKGRGPKGQKEGGAGRRGGDGEDEDNSDEEAPPPRKPAKAGRGAPVLPWMRVPVTIEAGEGVPLGRVGGLDPRLADALGASGISELFPVQAATWLHLAGGRSTAGDLCVCAPTGSGKTLAYVLPVVQALAGRVVPRLRALVVLPTLDLALQVHAVFQTVCPAVGLACGLCGQAAMPVERRALAAGLDILVCTPGRLMAHVARTPGFTLEHLRFLVVDETDRLLRQAYQDWLPHVVAACAGGTGEGDGSEAGEGWLGAGGARAVRAGHPERGRPEPCPRAVKIVLSATLTRDPSKISRLGLHCPRYIATSASDHRYKLPQQLEEYKLVCPEHMKPLVLLALLQHLPREPTILFASSVDATHRLHLLLSSVEGLPFRTAEYSSRQSPADRSRALDGFRSGEVGVLVASDAATRGIDIEGVGTVVNYDAPVYAKTYVHRVGRTARAGRGGRCFTLLRREDARHFRDMLRKADHNQVRDHQLPEGALEAWRPVYTDALARLQAAVEAEAAAAGAPSSRGAKAALPQVVRGQASRAFRLQAQAQGGGARG